MLFNEPKLLKFFAKFIPNDYGNSFSALQRAEIAEIVPGIVDSDIYKPGFSALQRAEIAEMLPLGIRSQK